MKNNKLILIVLIVVAFALTAGLGFYFLQPKAAQILQSTLPSPSSPASTTPVQTVSQAPSQAAQQQTTAVVQTGIAKSPYEQQLLRSMENGADKGKVFIVWDGLKRWIQSEETLNAFGGWGGVTTKGITNAIINSIPTGPSIA